MLKCEAVFTKREQANEAAINLIKAGAIINKIDENRRDSFRVIFCASKRDSLKITNVLAKYISYATISKLLNNLV